MKINNVKSNQNFNGAYTVFAHRDHRIKDPRKALKEASKVAKEACGEIKSYLDANGIKYVFVRNKIMPARKSMEFLGSVMPNAKIPNVLEGHAFLTGIDAVNYHRNGRSLMYCPNIPAEKNLDAGRILKAINGNSFNFMEGEILKPSKTPARKRVPDKTMSVIINLINIVLPNQ